MRRYLKGIYLEKDFPGPFRGVVIGDGHALLIDSPLRSEEVRDWLADVEGLAEPSYLVVLDTHPERALGARHFRLPRVAHAATSAAMSKLPDTYKGTAHPIGGETDAIKRITGVHRAIPDVIFRDEMIVELPGRPVRLIHRPGPTEGAIWVEVPDKSCLYVGDAVTVQEPPYVGNAVIEEWLETLDDLRGTRYEEYRIFSSRDGLVERDDINAMARFLRKIPVRLERMDDRENEARAATSIARELIEDFSVTKRRRPIALQRLEAGMLDLYRRDHSEEA